MSDTSSYLRRSCITSSYVHTQLISKKIGKFVQFYHVAVALALLSRYISVEWPLCMWEAWGSKLQPSHIKKLRNTVLTECPDYAKHEKERTGRSGNNVT